MSSYRIYHNSDRYDIRPHLIGVSAAAVEGGPLFWHRDGMVGKIPNTILRDTLAVYKSYNEMQQRGRVVDIPAAAYELTWDQTVEHRPVNAPPE